MSVIKLIAGSMLLLVLAACGDTDLERGATGAAAGAVTAEILGGNVVTGAVLGGAAGVISDDVLN